MNQDKIYIGCDFGDSDCSAMVIASIDHDGNFTLSDVPTNFTPRVEVNHAYKNNGIQAGIQLIKDGKVFLK